MVPLRVYCMFFHNICPHQGISLVKYWSQTGYYTHTLYINMLHRLYWSTQHSTPLSHTPSPLPHTIPVFFYSYQTQGALNFSYKTELEGYSKKFPIHISTGSSIPIDLKLQPLSRILTYIKRFVHSCVPHKLPSAQCPSTDQQVLPLLLIS